jgi:hypothetical protein
MRSTLRVVAVNIGRFSLSWAQQNLRQHGEDQVTWHHALEVSTTTSIFAALPTGCLFFRHRYPINNKKEKSTVLLLHDVEVRGIYIIYDDHLVDTTLHHPRDGLVPEMLAVVTLEYSRLFMHKACIQLIDRCSGDFFLLWRHMQTMCPHLW